MGVSEQIAKASSLLPGAPAREGETDPRWQEIIRIGEYIETEPEAVWDFIKRWGSNEQEDLRDAVACCLLEHLLEHHFDKMFTRVEECVARDRMFGDMFSRCWKFGQAHLPGNAERFDALQARCSESE